LGSAFNWIELFGNQVVHARLVLAGEVVAGFGASGVLLGRDVQPFEVFFILLLVVPGLVVFGNVDDVV